MPTIAVPVTAAGTEELVTVPRNIYEEFLVWQKKIKSLNTFKPTQAEKLALKRARKNLARGKFVTLEQIRSELGLTR